MLTIYAWTLIARTDLLLRRGKFDAVRRKLEATPVNLAPRRDVDVQDVVRAVARAATWYSARSPCLARSVVLAYLSRVYCRTLGVVVLGISQTPVKGHAWVEVDGIQLDEDLDFIQSFTEILRIENEHR